MNSTTSATGGDGAYCHIDQDNPQIQITSYQGNSVNVSNNGGASFTNIGVGGGYFISPTDYDDISNVLYGPFATNQYFYVSGVGSTNSINKITVSQFNGANPTAVKVSPNTPSRVYFATSGGQLFKLDNANTATPIVTTLGKPSTGNGWVSSIEIKEGNENHMVMTFSNYGVNSVWFSTDGGINWVSIEGALPDMPIRSAIFSPDGSGNIILGTETGVWVSSTINGSSTVWTPVNTGLATVRVDMLVSRKSDKMVMAATHGRGVFTSLSFGSVSTTCDVPTGLTATSIKSSSATLSWSFVGAATGYTVQYRPVITSNPAKPRITRIPADPNITPVVSSDNTVNYVWSNDRSSNVGVLAAEWKTVTVTTNSANLTGLDPLTKYEFQVKSNCSATTSSAYSTIASFTTTGIEQCAKVPTGLNVSFQSYPEIAYLNWTSQTDVKGYVVEWRKVGATTWSTDFTQFNYYSRLNSQLGLLPNTDYEYRVKTVCTNDAESAYSDIKTFKTLLPCSSPLTINVGQIFSNAAFVSWQYIYTEGYILAYRKAGTTEWFYGSFANRGTLLLDELAPSTTYEVKVKAACSSSSYSPIVTFTTKAASCADMLVTGLKTTNITTTSATLSWNPIAGVTSYNLTVYGLPTSFTQVVNGTSYDLTIPLRTGFYIYQFSVTPVCSSGTPYPYPYTGLFTIAEPCPNAAPFPNSWKATVTQTSARVHWNPVLNGSQYIVQYRFASSNSTTNVEWITAGTTTNLYFDLVGLLAGKTYDYRIIACNISGNFSYYANNTVRTADDFSLCVVPTSLTASSIKSSSATLSWNPVDPATGYTVQYRPVIASNPNKPRITRIPADPNIAPVVSSDNTVNYVWSNDRSSNVLKCQR